MLGLLHGYATCPFCLALHALVACWLMTSAGVCALLSRLLTSALHTQVTVLAYIACMCRIQWGTTLVVYCWYTVGTVLG